MTGIITSQSIRPSRPNFSTHGRGQYFTDISPETAAEGTARDMSRALFRGPHAIAKVVWCVEVEVDDLPVVRVADVYPNASFDSKYGIFLHQSEEPLPVLGRIRRAVPVAYARPGGQ